MATQAAKYRLNGSQWCYQPPGTDYWINPWEDTQAGAKRHYEAHASEYAPKKPAKAAAVVEDQEATE